MLENNEKVAFFIALPLDFSAAVAKIIFHFELFSISPDVFAQDSDGRLINIEIQRRDTADHARRTRYYSSMIDKSSLDKGTVYNELPDVYIIYISETDLWKAGKTVYPVNKFLGGTELPYDDGTNILFVNTAVDDGSEIAEMMQYFKTANPNDMSQGELSERVHYLKCEKGGYDIMCEAANKLFNSAFSQGREEGRIQGNRDTAVNLAAMGFPYEKIAQALKADVETVKGWLACAQPSV